MATEPIRVFAPAKVNLFLHVGERRGDGYHDLQSLIAFANTGDELSLEPGDGLSLTVNGPFSVGLEADARNIVAKAATRLAEKAGLSPNVRIALMKNLPVASGIGGGSADAAAALRGLCKLWKPPLGEAELQAIALALGADVPACWNGRPCYAEGIGERLTVIPAFPALPAVLVNPAVPVSTAQAFAMLERRHGTGHDCPKYFKGAAELLGFLQTCENDLEAAAVKLAPQIDVVLHALREIRETCLARMSGSGATCFGLYESKDIAQRVAESLAARHPDWWVKPVKLGSA